MPSPTPVAGTLTLIGSGELGPSMRAVHRAIARRIQGPIRPVFINTPAGFEPNVGDIAARAATYIERTIGARCEIASFTENSTPSDKEHALAVLRTSNYIFAGPGSPSYAIRLLRDSPVIDVVIERLFHGAQVVCASAAAIALGTRALPVYEIYKAGADLHWLDGLDVLGRAGVRLAVVPHWNNMEGGAHDTRCCFMGVTRFDRLASMLDSDVAVVGIDEHTALIVDFARSECTVMGAGAVTVRRGGGERRYAAGGDACPIEALQATSAQGAPSVSSAPPAAAETLRERLVRETARANELNGRRDGLTEAAALAFALAGEIEDGPAAGVDERVISEGRAALTRCVRELGQRLGEETGSGDTLTTPLLELLIDVRARLRSDGAWALADTIRDRLSSLGVTVEDTPTGTVWRRR